MRDWLSAAVEVSDVSEERIPALESAVEKDPNDVHSRLCLLGFYAISETYHNSPSRSAHALWFIEHYPDEEFTGSPYCWIDARADPAAYQLASDLWLGHLRTFPKDIRVAENSANFFSRHQWKTAEEALKHAEKLEPNNAKWPERISQLLLRNDNPLGAQTAADRALRLASNQPEEATLAMTAATAALACHNPDLAAAYASHALSCASSDDFDVRHFANIVLGKVALTKGDIGSAAACLVQAGKIEFSPRVGSLGPDMILAQRLLQAGERERVLQYLDLCSRFWSAGSCSIAEWTERIRRNETPDFGLQ